MTKMFGNTKLKNYFCFHKVEVEGIEPSDETVKARSGRQSQPPIIKAIFTLKTSNYNSGFYFFNQLTNIIIIYLKTTMFY